MRDKQAKGACILVQSVARGCSGGLKLATAVCPYGSIQQPLGRRKEGSVCSEGLPHTCVLHVKQESKLSG